MISEPKTKLQFLKEHYEKVQRQIRTRTLPRHMTNIGDIQSIRLKQIRELDPGWCPRRILY